LYFLNLEMALGWKGILFFLGDEGFGKDME